MFRFFYMCTLHRKQSHLYWEWESSANDCWDPCCYFQITLQLWPHGLCPGMLSSKVALPVYHNSFAQTYSQFFAKDSNRYTFATLFSLWSHLSLGRASNFLSSWKWCNSSSDWRKRNRSSRPDDLEDSVPTRGSGEAQVLSHLVLWFIECQWLYTASSLCSNKELQCSSHE